MWGLFVLTHANTVANYFVFIADINRDQRLQYAELSAVGIVDIRIY